MTSRIDRGCDHFDFRLWDSIFLEYVLAPATTTNTRGHRHREDTQAIIEFFSPVPRPIFGITLNPPPSLQLRHPDRPEQGQEQSVAQGQAAGQSDAEEVRRGRALLAAGEACLPVVPRSPAGTAADRLSEHAPPRESEPLLGLERSPRIPDGLQDDSAGGRVLTRTLARRP